MLAIKHAKLDKIIVFKPELLMNLISLFAKYTRIPKSNFSSILFLAAISITPLLKAESIAIKNLPGWQADNLVNAWPGWLASCEAFRKKKRPVWIKLCNASKDIESGDAAAIRAFFESAFKATPLLNSNGSTDGIITGYFEPVLAGKLKPDNQYRYPVYSKPEHQSLQTLSRQQIEQSPEKLEQSVIAWTNDPYDLFFLHVQGSGRIQLDDGSQKSLVYAGNNGHDYTSIGKVLINQGLMEKDNISMQTLKQWLLDHPEQATEILQQNKRYIFFNLQPTPENQTGPKGSLNVPLTPQRSIAIDPSKVTMGSPMWLETTLPGEPANTTFRRLVFAQDTGAAIKGNVRADVFFGQGEQAEYLAGHMNQNGRMYLLIPD